MQQMGKVEWYFWRHLQQMGIGHCRRFPIMLFDISVEHRKGADASLSQRDSNAAYLRRLDAKCAPIRKQTLWYFNDANPRKMIGACLFGLLKGNQPSPSFFNGRRSFVLHACTPESRLLLNSTNTATGPRRPVKARVEASSCHEPNDWQMSCCQKKGNKSPLKWG